MLILSIILGIVVMYTTALTMQLLRGGILERVETATGRIRRRFKGFTDLDEANWGAAIAIGAAAGVINYFSPRLYELGIIWLAPAFLIVMLAFTVGLIIWWHREGSDFKEMIPFIILAVLFYLTTKSAAYMTTCLWSSVFWTSVVITLPRLFLIAALGFFVIDAFYFRYLELDVVDDNDDYDEICRKEDAARRHHICGIVAIIVTTLLLLLFAIKGISWANFNFPTRTATYEPEAVVSEPSSPSNSTVVIVDPSPAVPEVATSDDEGSWLNDEKKWVHFYNLDMLKDKKESNDYNFGPNPVKKTRKAEDYDAIFRKRLKKDPALAAADTAWLDANVGTRYLGEFYESCKGDWAKTINAAKDRFASDQLAFYSNLDAFFLFLDHAYEVTIEHRTSGLDDQMYMNPFTPDGTPDVVVFETLDHEGWFLVYKFKIKGSTTTTDPETGEVKNIEVAYRIDCGFQPTNVEEVMDITPEPNPVVPTPDPTSTPTPDPPTPTPDPPTPTPDPPTPTPDPPTPTPTPKPEKDPEKAPKTDTEPNDDSGPGENTNNGEGATESPKDQPTNTDKYDSYEEYKKDMEELEETNKNQKTGEDSSKPSTPKPTEDTTVDNNGKSGTPDSAPIDDPTSKTKPAKEADTGETISDNPGEAWGGPPD